MTLCERLKSVLAIDDLCTKIPCIMSVQNTIDSKNEYIISQILILSMIYLALSKYSIMQNSKTRDASLYSIVYLLVINDNSIKALQL